MTDLEHQVRTWWEKLTAAAYMAHQLPDTSEGSASRMAGRRRMLSGRQALYMHYSPGPVVGRVFR